MKTTFAVIGAFLIGFSGQGATILQEQSLGCGIFYGQHLRGQSFLAQDPILSSIGVSLMVVNPIDPQTDNTTVNLSLFSGRGITGPLVAQRSITPALGLEPFTPVWVDFNVAGVAVEHGETYTFIIQSPTGYWCVQRNQWAYPSGGVIGNRIDYPGGEFLTDRGFFWYTDLTFRVETVPEPGTWMLLAMGGLVLILPLSRRKG